MEEFQRARHMDVNNSVDVTDAAAVLVATQAMLEQQYPALNTKVLAVLFADFSRLYRGDYPKYYGCEIRYHNVQHVLDVTLAMARLLEGQARSDTSEMQLSADLVLAGIAAALFHDSGYIRRRSDRLQTNGAAYTRIHVQRGAKFLSEYLPTVGLEHSVEVCTRLVHFTGYELEPHAIAVASEEEYLLGSLLGTADLIAQMADVEYALKCREYLYEEFVAGGMAGEAGDTTHTGTIYQSSEQLMRLTPDFIRTAIDVRLNGHFNGVHRFAAEHFGGRHLYMDAILENCHNLEASLAADDA